MSNRSRSSHQLFLVQNAFRCYQSNKTDKCVRGVETFCVVIDLEFCVLFRRFSPRKKGFGKLTDDAHKSQEKP